MDTFRCSLVTSVIVQCFCSGRDLDALRKGANGRNNTKQVVCQLRNKDLSRNGPQKRNDLFNRGREALSDNSRSRRVSDILISTMFLVWKQ